MPENSTAQRVGTSKERSQSRWGELLRRRLVNDAPVFPTAERFSPLHAKTHPAIGLSSGEGPQAGKGIEGFIYGEMKARLPPFVRDACGSLG